MSNQALIEELKHANEDNCDLGKLLDRTILALEIASSSYWEGMYNAQCACTDQWVAKFRAEVERKADATLQARSDELLQVAANANTMIGKERDQVARLQAEVFMLRDALQQLVKAHGRDFDLSDYMPLMLRALEQPQ